jgi:peptidoglycan/xylan/chitin deacetylase (PgdA/CDA1 family)
MDVKKIIAGLTAILLVFSTALFACTRGFSESIPMQKSTGGIRMVSIAHAAQPALPALSGANPAVTEVIEPVKTPLYEPQSQKIEPVKSLPDEPVTKAAIPEYSHTVSYSTAQRESYIVVPRFYNLSVRDAVAYLAGYGIDAQPEVDTVALDEIVSRVSFYGWWDGDNLYIKPGKEVILKVGAGEESHSKDTATHNTKNGSRIAYLTFDDGPTWYNTPRILNILENYGIKATFFVVGKSVASYPKRLKAIHDSGNAIGCHSYSHAYSEIYSSADAFYADMQRWHDAVSGELGEKFACSLYRMPGGTLTARKFSGYDAIREMLADHGFRIFDWNMSNNDVWSRTRAGGLSPTEYEKQCFEQQLEQLDAAGKPLIVLMHETYSSTVDMLPWAIELLIDKGYSFDTLDNFSGEFLH